MKRNVSRRLSSLNYVLRKAYQRLSRYKPSYTLFAFILIAAAIFLLGGGVYDTLDHEIFGGKPFPYWVSQQGEIIFFYPGRLQEQLLGGSVIVMILYALGTLGLLMAYRSAKYVHNPRQATILLVIGVIFIVLAFILIESIVYNYKIYFS